MHSLKTTPHLELASEIPVSKLKNTNSWSIRTQTRAFTFTFFSQINFSMTRKPSLMLPIHYKRNVISGSFLPFTPHFTSFFVHQCLFFQHNFCFLFVFILYPPSLFFFPPIALSFQLGQLWLVYNVFLFLVRPPLVCRVVEENIDLTLLLFLLAYRTRTGPFSDIKNLVSDLAGNLAALWSFAPIHLRQQEWRTKVN